MKEGLLDKSYFGKMVEAYDEAGRENPDNIRRQMAKRLEVATGSIEQVQQLETGRLIAERKLTMPTLKYMYTALLKIIRLQLLDAKKDFGILRAPGFTRKILELLKQQITLTGAQIAMEKTELSPEESEILRTCFNLCKYETAYVIDMIGSVVSDVENEELISATKGSVNSAMMN